MTFAKGDVLRKRLLSAGLSAEACTKYFETLRAFLSARLTKSRYEDEMLKVLPKEKIHIHNAIIQELLFRAQQKRDGVPDLPIVTPVKKPPIRKPPPLKANGPGPVERPKAGKKRPPEVIESDTQKPGISADATAPRLQKKPKIGDTKIPKKIPEGAKPSVPKPISGSVEKPTVKATGRPRRPDSTPSITRPSPGPASSQHMPPPKAQPQPQHAEIPTYDGLPYFPVRPGQDMDFEFFLKLRQRMRRIAVEQLGMSGLKDDAVSLMLHGIELHVKSLMAAGARRRAARDGVRPHRNLQCGPVRGFDFLESARRNPGLLGDEAGLELERLLMLL